MVFRAMDPFFMACNCLFALQECKFEKSGQLKLTNGQWCDIDAFMAILFKWRGENLNSTLVFPLLNLSLTSKSWRFPVVALGTLQVAQDPNCKRAQNQNHNTTQNPISDIEDDMEFDEDEILMNY